MAYHIPKASIKIAIAHLGRYGDTDIFPALPEIAFFVQEIEAVSSELSKLDLDVYEPGGSIESLAPKSRYGFRIAHQLTPIDTVLYLACAIEIGGKIEAYRMGAPRAFSYRFKASADGQIFLPNHSYRNWLNHQKEILEAKKDDISHVIITDISDFYQRINFHRLENYLDESASKTGAAKFLKKYVKSIRAKQSFGLPVGGSASRILSELVLTDTDKELQDYEYIATRFVDDFRIFVQHEEEPYEIVALIAEQLSINEGLSLNVAKTRVLSRTDFADTLSESMSDLQSDAEDAALEALTADIYFDDDPDPDDIAKLSHMNLLEHLSDELDEEVWDNGKIKVLFRALRITKHPDSIEYIINNFEDLIIFAKDLSLLMEALNEGNPNCFNVLLDRVLDAVLRPPASSVQLIQSWLLELFVRGVIDIPISKLKRIEKMQSALLRRQILLIRGRKGDVNFFRKNKTAAEQFSNNDKFALIWGASCLPDDEFSNWLPTIKANFKVPLATLYCTWVKNNSATISAKLGSPGSPEP